jgi:hypothetical protein
MKRIRYWKLVVVALPLCSSCGRNSTPTKPTVTSTYKTQETDNVLEALLSEVIPNEIPRGYTQASYISLNGQDPSPTLIQRMRRLKIRIEKVSLSPVPYSRSNRGRGIERMKNIQMFVILPIEWLSPSLVEVICERPGQGTRYTLAQTNGKWTVTARRVDWIE